MMFGKILNKLGGMPAPNRPMHDPFNHEFERERYDDTDALSQSEQHKVPLLNQQQKTGYDTIMKAVYDGNGGILLIDAPGGNGKIFLIS